MDRIQIINKIKYLLELNPNAFSVSRYNKEEYDDINNSITKHYISINLKYDLLKKYREYTGYCYSTGYVLIDLDNVSEDKIKELDRLYKFLNKL